jgi:hypothetical protein
MGKIWKEISDYKGLYLISEQGDIKSVRKDKPYRRHNIESKAAMGNRILKPWLSKAKGRTTGYFKVRLTKNEIEKDFYLHRLIAEAFLPNPKNKPEVNHINGIKTDNNINNLEWVTGSENAKHAVKNGLIKIPKFTGFKNGK